MILIYLNWSIVVLSSWEDIKGETNKDLEMMKWDTLERTLSYSTLSS